MCVRVCVFIHTYIHIYVCMYVSMYTNTHTHTHTHTHRCQGEENPQFSVAQAQANVFDMASSSSSSMVSAADYQSRMMTSGHSAMGVSSSSLEGAFEDWRLQEGERVTATGLGTGVHGNGWAGHSTGGFGHSLSAGSRRKESSEPVSTVIPRRKPGQANDARPVYITLDVLERCANMSLVKASIMLGISPTSMKKACRRLGITRWPPPVSTDHAAPAQIDGAYVRRIQRKHAASMRKALESSAGGSTGAASLQAVVIAETQTPPLAEAPPSLAAEQQNTFYMAPHSLAAKQSCDWSSSAEAAGLLSATAASVSSSGIQPHTSSLFSFPKVASLSGGEASDASTFFKFTRPPGAPWGVVGGVAMGQRKCEPGMSRGGPGMASGVHGKFMEEDGENMEEEEEFFDACTFFEADELLAGENG